MLCSTIALPNRRHLICTPTGQIDINPALVRLLVELESLFSADLFYPRLEFLNVP